MELVSYHGFLNVFRTQSRLDHAIQVTSKKPTRVLLYCISICYTFTWLSQLY